jgi:DNA-binding NarL/FixJ family response regulator
VCDILRRDPDDPTVPIILVSAAAETDARLQAFARGADDYLAKPFGVRELVQSGMVALGDKFLIMGYWVLTLAICGLLYLIAIDYGIHMEKVDVTGQPAPPTPAEATPTAEVPRLATSAELRAKRRVNTI